MRKSECTSRNGREVPPVRPVRYGHLMSGVSRADARPGSRDGCEAERGPSGGGPLTTGRVSHSEPILAGLVWLCPVPGGPTLLFWHVPSVPWPEALRPPWGRRRILTGVAHRPTTGPCTSSTDGHDTTAVPSDACPVTRAPTSVFSPTRPLSNKHRG